MVQDLRFFFTLKQVAYDFPRFRRFGKRMVAHAQWINALAIADVYNIQNIGSHVAHVQMKVRQVF